MERELRQQEDYIYELEDYLMEYSEKLRECRSCQMAMAAPAKSAQRSSAPPTGEPTIADDRPRSQAPQRGQRGRVAPPVEPFEEPSTVEPAAPEAEPEPQAIDPTQLEAPELDVPPTSDLQWKNAAPIATTPAGSAPGDEAPPYIPDPANYQFEIEPLAIDDAALVAEAAPQEVSETPSPTLPELTLSEPELSEPALSEPMLPPTADPSRLIAEKLNIRCIYAEPANPDTGKAPSLLVVVEALNATDEPVDANGEISLMVMAGEDQASLQRIDRWDFTAEETVASWQSSPLGDGLHLELPLNKAELPAGPIELWARIVRDDGTKLLARVPFAVDQLTSLEAAEAEPGEDTAPAQVHEVEPPTIVAATAETADAGASPDPEPISQWRASSQPLQTGRVEGFASTTDAQGGGWTSQPAGGRAPLPTTPRVAAGQGGKPRWQQGSATPSATANGENWTPFR